MTVRIQRDRLKEPTDRVSYKNVHARVCVCFFRSKTFSEGMDPENDDVSPETFGPERSIPGVRQPFQTSKLHSKF